LYLLTTSARSFKSTALYLQLVRAIQAGVDADQDGAPDLDPSRIYFYGHSLGASYGMLTFRRRARDSRRRLRRPRGNVDLQHAARRRRSALASARRSHGVRRHSSIRRKAWSRWTGVDVAEPRFNENLPYAAGRRWSNTVPGALAIQRVADRTAWAAQIAGTVAAAPLLRRTPLAGIGPASVHRPGRSVGPGVHQSGDERVDPLGRFRGPRGFSTATI
jgi:hypothetical protein